MEPLCFTSNNKLEFSMSLIQSPDWEKINILILDFDSNIYSNITSKCLNPVIKSCCIPKDNALDIYISRANSPTKVMNGFEVLIDNLEKLEDSLIYIHSVSTSKSKIIVFSDCSLMQILGILSLPDSGEHTGSSYEF
jgi:hypothetical protein